MISLCKFITFSVLGLGLSLAQNNVAVCMFSKYTTSDFIIYIDRVGLSRSFAPFQEPYLQNPTAEDHVITIFSNMINEKRECAERKLLFNKSLHAILIHYMNGRQMIEQIHNNIQ